jgi:hypothetical protein
MDYYFVVGRPTGLGDSSKFLCYQRCQVSDGQHENLVSALLQTNVSKIKARRLANCKETIQETNQRSSFTLNCGLEHVLGKTMAKIIEKALFCKKIFLSKLINQSNNNGHSISSYVLTRETELFKFNNRKLIVALLSRRGRKEKQPPFGCSSTNKE